MTRYHCTKEGHIQFSAEEEAHWDAMEAEWEAGANDRAAAEIRTKRDAKLADSDWTQVAGAPVDQEAWATYRQELRDITEQEGFPVSINWPAKPS